MKKMSEKMENIPKEKITELLDLIEKHNKYNTFNDLIEIIDETRYPDNIENLGQFLKKNSISNPAYLQLYEKFLETPRPKISEQMNYIIENNKNQKL